MNRHKIFSSLFSLNFKNSEIDKLFRKYKNEEKKLKILIVFLVCTQIINTILSYILKPMNFSISFENRLYLNTIFPQIKIYTYFCIFITIVITILFCFKKNEKISYVLEKLTHLVYTFVTDNLIIIGVTYSTFQPGYYFFIVYNLYLLFVSFYIFFFECRFLKVCFTYLIWLVILIIEPTVTSTNKIIFISSKVIITIIVYFVEKTWKTVFYYDLKLGIKCDWIDSILKHMQSGLVIHDSNEVIYTNEYASKNLQYLFQQTSCYNTISNNIAEINNVSNHPFYLPENSIVTLEGNNIKKYPDKLKLNDDIFKDIDIFNLHLPIKLEEIFMTKTFDEICLILYQENYFKSEFKYIGNKVFKNEKEKFFNEIYLRVNEKYGKKHLEFIFHDISKTREIEESKAKIKFQSIFLKKICHEFKNPFIGVISLLDEIVENNVINFPNVTQNISYAKNLTLFNIMLVKDFEILSNSITKTEFEIKPTIFDIREEMEIIRNIANTLLYTLSKNQVQFIIDISSDIQQYITFDKTLLLQIIMNLLTNSIKFTQSGIITLSISKDNRDDLITISLIDTGKGISPDMKTNLFRSFFKEEKMNNDSGLGLGLALVTLICQKLDIRIEHRDNDPLGSIFYFSFKNNNENTNNSYLKQVSMPSNNETIILKEWNTNNNFVKFLRNNTISIFHGESSNIKNDQQFKSKRNINLDSFVSDEEQKVSLDFNSSFSNKLKFEPIFKIIYDDINPNTNRDIIMRILVVDDDKLVRNSTIRIIKQFFENGYPDYNLEIVEACDGIECLYNVYKCNLNKQNINFILLDETMKFMNGSKCYNILNEMFLNNTLRKIPIFMVTALESCMNKSRFNNNSIIIFSKPFTKHMLTEIIKNIHPI